MIKYDCIGTWYIIDAFLPFSNVLLTLAIFVPEPSTLTVIGLVPIKSAISRKDLLDISVNGHWINWSIIKV